MMMATGFGAAIMAPALGINYLFQQRPRQAVRRSMPGYFVVGMAAMGGVFVAFCLG